MLKEEGHFAFSFAQLGRGGFAPGEAEEKVVLLENTRVSRF